MKMIELNEAIGHSLCLEPLMESVNNSKRMYLEGIHAQAEIININRRRYPNKVLSESVEDYNRDWISTSKSIGELNHPEHPLPNPYKAAIFIKKLTMEGNNAVGKSEVLDNTPCGKIIYSLNERGVRLGVSTRGLGSIMESRAENVSIVTRYKMTAIDSVLNPSAMDAVPKAIMESAEWMLSEGQLKDSFILDEMIKASRLDTDARVHAFLGFMESLSNQD